MIRNDANVWLNSREEIAECITQHFLKIATTVNPEIDQNIINLIPISVTQNDNETLCAIPTENEIKKKLYFSWNLIKARDRMGSHPTSFNRIGKL